MNIHGVVMKVKQRKDPVELQFEDPEKKKICHVPLRGHPEPISWILEESSTGFRRNDIYFESVSLPESGVAVGRSPVGHIRVHIDIH